MAITNKNSNNNEIGKINVYRNLSARNRRPFPLRDSLAGRRGSTPGMVQTPD